MLWVSLTVRCVLPRVSTGYPERLPWLVARGSPSSSSLARRLARARAGFVLAASSRLSLSSPLAPGHSMPALAPPADRNLVRIGKERVESVSPRSSLLLRPPPRLISSRRALVASLTAPPADAAPTRPSSAGLGHRLSRPPPRRVAPLGPRPLPPQPPRPAQLAQPDRPRVRPRRRRRQRRKRHPPHRHRRGALALAAPSPSPTHRRVPERAPLTLVCAASRSRQSPSRTSTSGTTRPSSRTRFSPSASASSRSPSTRARSTPRRVRPTLCDARPNRVLAP